MSNQNADEPSVLSSLGVFHIWVNILLGPVFLIILVTVAILVWRNRRNWETGRATVKTTPDCHPCVNKCADDSNNYECVNVETILQYGKGHTSALTLDQEDVKAPLHKGDTLDLCFDPKVPRHHSSGKCMSSSVRTRIVVCCFVAAAMVLVFWLVNLTLRKNRSWQNISGVMEGASLVGDAFGRR